MLRDDGIVMSISVLQWTIEMGYYVLYFVYYNIFHGCNIVADKCFIIFNFFVLFVVEPAFYINGDSQFRRKLANEGFFSALFYAATA